MFAKHRDDVFDGHDVELVIGLKIDRDSIFWVEDNLIVLAQGHIRIVLNLAADGDDSAGYGGDFGGIRQSDPPFGLPFGLVFKNQDSGSDGFDGLESVFLGHS